MIRRLVGRGGMGEVYLADDPHTGQRAAVKVLTSTTAEAAARFEREQRQLAALQHEAVPRLLGTGTTEDGRPCFAMEYVWGAPITDFARAHALDVTERVELFALLCDAVRHAHAQLVVHRDIKPSNVLASKAPDGTCRVHLLDFGVARPLADRAYSTTWGGGEGGPTGAGLRPMTPAYAAPEQALPAGAGPDAETTTATDVFALGVLLYELMTGRRPLDGGAAPSRVSNLKMGRLAQAIDAIVARAIDPDPDARYASADAIHADVRRVLMGRAPAAVGTGLSARSLWFLARHRIGLLTAAVGVAAVVLAFAAADRRWRSALGASEGAGREVVGAVAGVLSSASGEGPPGHAMLVRAGGALKDEFRGHPTVEADLSLVVADELARRGGCDAALPLYGRAALLRTTSAPDHPIVVAALRGQARCAARLGGPNVFGLPSASDVRQAIRLTREALILATSRYGEESTVTASLETDLALYSAYAGDPEAATARLRRVDAILERLRRNAAVEGEQNREVRETAGTYVPAFPRAEGSGAVALAASRAETVLATALMAQGHPEMAVEQAREAVARLLAGGLPTEAGPPHDVRAEVVALALLTEAHALRQTGDDDRAREAAERAAATLSRQFGGGDPRAIRARTTAAALRGPETPQLTAALLSEVVADAEKTGEPATLAYALLERGRALRRAGDTAEAEASFDRVTAMRPEDVAPRTLALALSQSSALALETGDVARALDHSTASLRTALTLLPAAGYSLDVHLSAATARADALVAAGRENDAVTVLEPVLRAARSGPSWSVTAEACERASGVLEAAYERLK